MSQDHNRTLVCSVLFVDIVGYSKRDVAEQVRMKQTFNGVLSDALGAVEPRDRVLIDTGDGAAIAFLGDPESALFVALGVLDHIGQVPVRLGINLGPVTLMKDLNGADNVIGDGINAAQRIMGFAAQGQLLVSRSFYEVVTRLSDDYATLFRHAGSRTDKHVREHDIYAVSDAVRVGRRVAEAQSRLKAQRRSEPVTTDRGPAQVFDAGSHFIVSAASREGVDEALARLVAKGCKLISPAAQVGTRWVASVDNPRLAVSATVEEFGLKRMVSGPTREAVELKVKELLQLGAILVQEIEFADGAWTAVCERS